MLGSGDPVPAATVWPGALDDPVPLLEALAGDEHSLLCFYPFDFSPG